MKRLLLSLLLSIFLAGGYTYATTSTEKPKVAVALKKEAPVEATLLAEEQSVQAARSFWVGIELKLAPGWDTYWVNPGEAGMATQVKWHLPEGYSVGPIQWPAPEKFDSDNMTVFGYTRSVVLLAQITPPHEIQERQVEIKADVNWLACKESCVPGEAHISIQLPVTKDIPLKNSNHESRFNEARLALPVNVHETTFDVATASIDESKLQLSLGAPTSLQGAYFISETRELIDYQNPQVFAKSDQGDGYSLSLPLSHSDQPLPDRLKGVLIISDHNSASQKIAIDLPLHSHAGAWKFFAAIIGALIGGLILNVMPCVLPVIALKVMSFVKMAGSCRSTLMRHSGAFTLGVLISFWALTALLLLLKAAGASVGWGFQLQEPLFVAVMVALLFVFALSLFGLFEMGTSLMRIGQSSENKSPLTSAFCSGVLATLVATPCTGPLLGPALGFAITLPVVKAFTIFTAMALGMALPYILFALFPALLRFLPKPGTWMIVFKQLMGFVMMASALWLLWVFAAQTGVNATVVLLAILFLLSVAAWIFGKWATPVAKKTTRRFALGLIVALLTLSGAALYQLPKLSASTHEISAVSQTAWPAFSEEKVKQLRHSGKAVFIDFTAKWCLICQANKIALHSFEIEQAFKEKNVVALEADWTKKSPEITAALEKMGRTGVPVYVLYPKDPEAKPIILPQTLSRSIVLDYLQQLDK